MYSCLSPQHDCKYTINLKWVYIIILQYFRTKKCNFEKVKAYIKELQQEETKSYSMNIEDIHVRSLYDESKLLFKVMNLVKPKILSQNWCLNDEQTKIVSTSIWDIVLLNLFDLLRVNTINLSSFYIYDNLDGFNGRSKNKEIPFTTRKLDILIKRYLLPKNLTTPI